MAEHLLQQTASTCYSTCYSTAAVATGQQSYRELLKDPRGLRFACMSVRRAHQNQNRHLLNARDARRLVLMR